MGYEDKIFTERDFLVADSNFFEFFSFPLISGDPKTALKGMNKIVLTESAAKRYSEMKTPWARLFFGAQTKSPVRLPSSQDPPSNSHIQFSMILSSQSWEYLRITISGHPTIHTRILKFFLQRTYYK